MWKNNIFCVMTGFSFNFTSSIIYYKCIWIAKESCADFYFNELTLGLTIHHRMIEFVLWHTVRLLSSDAWAEDIPGKVIVKPVMARYTYTSVFFEERHNSISTGIDGSSWREDVYNHDCPSFKYHTKLRQYHRHQSR